MRPHISNMPAARRPEGPTCNSRGRKAVVGDLDGMSAEGAALIEQLLIECRTFGALLLHK